MSQWQYEEDHQWQRWRQFAEDLPLDEVVDHPAWYHPQRVPPEEDFTPVEE